ncbi:carboxypeptidase-like regulatory domain-containing protein [Tunturibacter empetritectus]|uniref:Carboxypeptidase-like regulatory domain-containing protein n=1 Tax=Tunturiibacter empetritectus TaxID=3069691 RepID=A0AAU7ZBC3_9BACT
MRWSLVEASLLLFAGGLFGIAHAQTRAQTKPEAKHIAVGAHYEINGVVVSSIDGSPVPHCRLTPTLVAQGVFGSRRFPSSTDGSEADEHGHFSIPLPSAGVWNLRASARGYVTQSYEEHGAFSSAVVLTADSPEIDLRFKISPEASIKGLVLDEAGEPVRDAQISLFIVPPSSPGGPPANTGSRVSARTDDRGMYELTNLSPGGYRLSVRARPWYAEVSQQSGIAVAGSPVDPSLDVAYPPTWFPGGSDVATAETIVLHAGDTRQADFHLVPIASIHLKIAPPSGGVGGANVRQGQAIPIVEEIMPGANAPRLVSVATHRDLQGEFDVGGLTPGLYQVRIPGQDGRSTVVDVVANSVRTLDLDAPRNDIARVTVHIDGFAGETEEAGDRRGRGLRVNLIDTDTQRGTFSSAGDEGGFAGRRGSRAPSAESKESKDRIIEVPPGRYEVVLQGGSNIFLTGLTAKGAEASGRYVTVPAGETTLTVHVANGRANVSGIAALEGKPAVGAMALLVPITIEEPDSIDFLRQDQTNTDGSFDIENVIPGQYILVVIDKGWQINWGDRSTLRRYLTQGVPMELKPSASVKQNVVAQAP